MTKSDGTKVSVLKDDVWLMMMESSMQWTNNWMVKDRAEGFAPTDNCWFEMLSTWEVVSRLMGGVWDRCVPRWVEVVSWVQEGVCFGVTLW